MGRHNFDDGATQLICWGDTTPMLGRRNFGWSDITWGDKAMGRHNLHSSEQFSMSFETTAASCPMIDCEQTAFDSTKQKFWHETA